MSSDASGKDVVETIYGKYNKFEIVREKGGVFTSTKFYIYKGGKYHRGSFSSLRDAVEAAKQEG
jgi:hypothetical protein